MTKFVPKQTFSFSGNINWFPGHMYKATKEITEKLQQIDTILEIRDARISKICLINIVSIEKIIAQVTSLILYIPFSSANSSLESLIESKNRLIVLNKSDLSDPTKHSVGHEQSSSQTNSFRKSQITFHQKICAVFS